MAEEKPMNIYIDRQMLLAKFAAAALTGYLAYGKWRWSLEDTAVASLDAAEAMLAEYEKRIK